MKMNTSSTILLAGLVGWLASVSSAGALTFSAPAVSIVTSASSAEEISSSDINMALGAGESVSLAATEGDLTLQNGAALSSGTTYAQLSLSSLNAVKIGFALGDSISGDGPNLDDGLALSINSSSVKFDGSLGKIDSLNVSSYDFSMRQSLLEVSNNMFFSYGGPIGGLLNIGGKFDFTGKTLRAGGNITMEGFTFPAKIDGAYLESANGTISVNSGSIIGATINAMNGSVNLSGGPSAEFVSTKINARTSVNVSTMGGDIIDAQVNAGGEVMIAAGTAGGENIVGGVIVAEGMVHLQANGDFANYGNIIGTTVFSNGLVWLDAGENIQDVTISSKYEIFTQAQESMIGGSFSAPRVYLNASYIRDAAVTSRYETSVFTWDGDTQGGTINAGTQAIVEAGNDIQGVSVRSGTDTTFIAGNTINGGNITAGGTATLTASNSISGVSIVANSASLNAPTLAGNTLVVNGSVQLSALNTLRLGDTIAGGTLTLVSPDIRIDGLAKAHALDITGNTQVDGSLQGSGTVQGNLYIGGALLPGNSPGQITVNGDITFGQQSQTFIELAGLTAGTEYDTITSTGIANIDGSLNITLLGGLENTLNGSETFTIVESAGLTGQFKNLPNGSLLSTADAKGFFTVNYSGNSVSLTNFSPIPEPSHFAMIGGALALAIGWVRRRR